MIDITDQALRTASLAIRLQYLGLRVYQSPRGSIDTPERQEYWHSRMELLERSCGYLRMSPKDEKFLNRKVRFGRCVNWRFFREGPLPAWTCNTFNHIV